MQHQLAAAAAKQDPKTSVTRKRKLPPSASPADTTAASAPKQQTISDLFSSQQKASILPDSPPSSKRPKLPGIANGTCPASPAAQHQQAPLPPSKMYNFPTRSPKNNTTTNNNNNVIDLTGSPGGTPSPRRPSVPRPLKPSFNPHAGAKKLVVKNLRPSSGRDPRVYLEQVWGLLDRALGELFGGSAEGDGGKDVDGLDGSGARGANGMNGAVKLSTSMEELYKGVENLCRQGLAGELCARLEGKSREYVGGPVRERLVKKVGEESVDVLRAVLKAWAVWNRQVMTVRSIFFYMDRSYLLQSSRPSIQEMAVAQFRSIIFEDPKLRGKIIDGACDLVAADRAGQQLDHTTFRDAITMFHDLSAYTTIFEPRFLELSQSYVLRWAETAVVEKGLADYVRSAVGLMEKEKKRCEMFGLDATTRRDLVTMLEDHLIQRQQERLVNQDDLADLLEDDAVEDLEQLYLLLERRHLGTKLREPFVKWIDDAGTAIVFDEKEQDQMVVKLLGMKRQLDTIWRVSFRRNDELGHALRESFETFINKSKRSSATWGTDNTKVGEMIAKYLDVLLRGGAKAIPASLASAPAKPAGTAVDEDEADDVAFDEDTEVNNQLDQVLDLFRFVHGKAVFEAFYKKDLARRLLMGRSASADAERSMLARLKTECGAGFTQNLEQMFKDVELAREELSSYKSMLHEKQQTSPIDLSVNILSASAWPTYPDIPVIIPPDIKSAIDKFETYYKSKHSGRKLEWKHALAHCQIKADFPRGKKEIVVSSFQAVVLLLFNGVAPEEKVSYETIKAATGLPEADLHRTLQSLACAKLRPLTKHPKGRDISPTDSFTLNASFTHEKYRIKVNQVQLKETAAENKATHEQVQADRNFETQAAIVRIMKSRKTIGHSQLVAEVIEATRRRGVLGVADIKRNIDRLIEKEYMEREEDGGYSYIA